MEWKKKKKRKYPWICEGRHDCFPTSHRVKITFRNGKLLLAKNGNEVRIWMIKNLNSVFYEAWNRKGDILLVCIIRKKEYFTIVPKNFGWNLMSYFSWYIKDKDSQSMKNIYFYNNKKNSGS